MSKELVYPSGEWTHSDFAEANGKTKPSVYNQLQTALKNGTVVRSGFRTGHGKPSQLYKVAGTVATPTVEAPKAKKVVEPKPEKKTVVKPVVKATEPVVKKPEPVVVAEVVPTTVTEEPVEVPQFEGSHVLSEVCPVCKHPLTAYRDSTGVMVKCIQPMSVCKSQENPYGHGRSEKEAYNTLVEKWTFCLKSSV